MLRDPKWNDSRFDRKEKNLNPLRLDVGVSGVGDDLYRVFPGDSHCHGVKCHQL